MNVREWNKAVKLWQRAYGTDENENGFVPSIPELKDWFDKHRQADMTAWIDWPEGLALRVYLSKFCVYNVKGGAKLLQFPRRTA